MNEHENFPKVKMAFSAENLNLLESFNISYYVITPLRARYIYSKEVGSGHNYLGNALVKHHIDGQPVYFEINVSTVESSLTIYSPEEERIASLIEKHVKAIQNEISAVEQLKEEDRKKVIHTISIRQQIDQILSKLLNKESPRTLYTPACNIREGFILIIDRLNSEDQDIIQKFQDMTLKYQTIINLIQKYHNSETFEPEENEKIGISLLQSKQILNQFIDETLKTNK